jgi:dihydrofolate synthase/folylpolyglutamate synthase
VNYPETLEYLYNALPMFSRIGSAAYKKDLDNIKFICNELGNPQDRIKTIHIAGTNGKGSVSHMLAAIFQQAGYKTGLYTSPHLYDFRERIKISGEKISEDYVVKFTDRMKPVIEKIQPSFFEITVAMAFEYFTDNSVDIAIIEVGLGGRLDSTNIIRPILSVITNIGWDHMNLLGNSLEEIAFEKGGIIKEHIPVIIGEKNSKTEPVFREIASKNKSPIFFAEDNITINHYQLIKDRLKVTLSERGKQYHLNLDLSGIYQIKNVRTVLQTINELRDWKIGDNTIQTALSNVRKLTGFQGRWDIIHHNPLIVLDVAHNPDGIEQMLHHIRNINFNNLHIILGTVKDKEIDSMLSLFPKDATYYFSEAQIPRALPAKELQARAKEYLLNGNFYNEVNNALNEALNNALEDDMILICGSIFLVAEVNRTLVAQLT